MSAQRPPSGHLVATPTVLRMKVCSLPATPLLGRVTLRSGQAPAHMPPILLLARKVSEAHCTNVPIIKLVSHQNISQITEPASLMKKQNVPGPGTYPLIGIDKMGRYPLSTFKNSGAQTWSPAPSTRQSRREPLPGPGAHNVLPDSFSSSNYVLSNNKTLFSGKINPPATSHSRNRSAVTAQVSFADRAGLGKLSSTNCNSNSWTGNLPAS